MGVPRLAKHNAGLDDAAAGSILGTSLEAEAVTHAKVDHDGDFTMGSVSAKCITTYGTHTGVALADLTAAFGDPAGLTNGTLLTYKNTTDSKVYLVCVVNGGFAIEELTAVSA